jgi:hypothetical protein
MILVGWRRERLTTAGLGTTQPMTEDETESNGGSDSDTSDESFEGSDDPTQISDDQLPEDLRPTDDNPLAKPEGEDDDEGGDGGLNMQEQAGGAGGAPG